MKTKYTAKYKAEVVQQILREEKTISQLATEYGIHVTQLRQWKRTVLEGMVSLFEDVARQEQEKRRQQEQEKEELYAEIGRLTTQLNWLKKKGGLHVESK